jgi:metal-dependent amidase/aminoacylase/carboxypeptidase family protein
MYEKTVWVNRVTPVNAENLNKIEEGVEQLDTLQTALTGYIKGIVILTRQEYDALPVTKNTDRYLYLISNN